MKALTKNQERWLFWGMMAIGQFFAFLMFKDLADISQWVIQSSREFTMGVWYSRHYLFVGVVIAMAVTIWLWRNNRSLVGKKVFVALIGFMVINTYSGYFNPQFMFRPLQYEAKFVPNEEAPNYLNRSLPYMAYGGKGQLKHIDEISMVVLETDKEVLAYADYYLLQPHVVKGGKINGEEVVMTYCGLTNLAIAVTPEIGGEKLDLGVMTQLDNNLVMFDKNTDEPIQQLQGRLEGEPEKGKMKEWATIRMPYGSFKQLYPEGKVFVNEIPSFIENPLLATWDYITRNVIMYNGVGLQWNTENAAFPTITHFDERLPRKAMIYGFNIKDDYVAYTAEFIQKNSIKKPINVNVGGQDVVLNYNTQYQTIGVFYNTAGTEISKVDFWGNSNNGKLKRLENLKTDSFWFIWAHFFPKTDVNRIG